MRKRAHHHGLAPHSCSTARLDCLPRLPQACLAQECDSEITAAREAQCSDDVFVPKSCRDALMDGSTAFRATAAVWMANAAYDDKQDGV